MPSAPSPPPPPPPPPPPSVGTFTTGIQRHGTTPHTYYLNPGYLNTPRPDDASLRVDPNNDTIIAHMVMEADPTFNGLHPILATTSWSLPTYTVQSDVPFVPVKIHAGAADGTGVPNYQKASQQIMLDPGIRIPSVYKNEGTSDDEAGFYSPTENVLWEFWRLRPITPMTYSYPMPDGSTWTGTVKYECTNFWQYPTVSTHPGRSRNFNPGTYPNAPTTTALRALSENTNMSVSAAKIPFVATNLTVEDVNRGRVDHLMNICIVQPMPSVHWWPAAATDGYKTGSPVAEGMRFFFPKTVTIPTTLHPLCQLVMQGIRDYGCILLDKGGCIEIDAEPGVHDFFDGTLPSNILNGFPWGSLKVMAQTNGDGSALTDANPFPHA